MENSNVEFFTEKEKKKKKEKKRDISGTDEGGEQSADVENANLLSYNSYVGLLLHSLFELSYNSVFTNVPSKELNKKHSSEGIESSSNYAGLNKKKHKKHKRNLQDDIYEATTETNPSLVDKFSCEEMNPDALDVLSKSSVSKTKNKFHKKKKNRKRHLEVHIRCAFRRNWKRFKGEQPVSKKKGRHKESTVKVAADTTVKENAFELSGSPEFDPAVFPRSKVSGKKKNNLKKKSNPDHANGLETVFFATEKDEAVDSYLEEPNVKEWLASLEADMVEEELDFEPPELHRRCPLLRRLTAKEKEELKQDGVGVRLGRWNYKEDEIIRRNMRRFAEKYNVPYIPMLLGINRNSKEKIPPDLLKYLQLKKFSFNLAKDLPLRSLYSTYQRARRIFHPMDASRLKKEELTQLFRLQAKIGNKWNTLSEMMNKPSKILFEAARYHTEKGDTGDWTPEENEKLFNAVIKKLSMNSDGTCRKLPWKKIARKVGTRNSQQCCRQWLHKLCWKFSHGEEVKPKWTDEDSLRLIHHLYQTEAESEADLDWDSIFSKFSKPPPRPAKKTTDKTGNASKEP